MGNLKFKVPLARNTVIDAQHEKLDSGDCGFLLDVLDQQESKSTWLTFFCIIQAVAIFFLTLVIIYK